MGAGAEIGGLGDGKGRDIDAVRIGSISPGKYLAMSLAAAGDTAVLAASRRTAGASSGLDSR